MRLPHGHSLQIGDRPPYAKPDELSVVVATFQYLIGSSGGDDLGLGFMFPDQQVGGSPNVAIRNHSGSSRSAEPQAAPFLAAPNEIPQP
jgi:hypothetical protein